MRMRPFGPTNMYMQYAACNVYRSIRERILEWDDMQCVYTREVSERDHKQYVYVCPPSGSWGGSGTETREESGNGTTGIYMQCEYEYILGIGRHWHETTTTQNKIYLCSDSSTALNQTNSTGGLTWSCTRKKRKFRRSLASNS